MYGPQGLAFGPDGLLYATIRSFNNGTTSTLFGAILRFDVSTPPGVRLLHAK